MEKTMPAKHISAPVKTSVLAHLSADEKAALRHLAAERGATLSRTVRSLIQDALAKAKPRRK
jgi:macrodomain Ter protein organizer (MatP/YcbG family)